MDPIADGLTKIRNASRARHPSVDVRPSGLLARMLEVLKQEGFIRTYQPVGTSPAQQRLRVYLKYVEPPAPPTSGEAASSRSGGGRSPRSRAGGAPLGPGKGSRPAIRELVRVSKPGMRRYCTARALPRVRGGLGVALVSTSNGVMTDRDAYRQRIGGEVLCYVW